MGKRGFADNDEKAIRGRIGREIERIPDVESFIVGREALLGGGYLADVRAEHQVRTKEESGPE